MRLKILFLQEYVDKEGDNLLFISRLG